MMYKNFCQREMIFLSTNHIETKEQDVELVCRKAFRGGQGKMYFMLYAKKFNFAVIISTDRVMMSAHIHNRVYHLVCVRFNILFVYGAECIKISNHSIKSSPKEITDLSIINCYVKAIEISWYLFVLCLPSQPFYVTSLKFT